MMSDWMKRSLIGSGCLVLAGTAAAQATFVGPVPYTSQASTPAGFYAPDAAVALEDFEDCSLDEGLSATAGTPVANAAGSGCTGYFGVIDSVDADDGVIDGSGSNGRSFFSASGSSGITLTFPYTVEAAGAVWTDGEGLVTFEAFGPGMISLGTVGPDALADGMVTGETAEDRFYGVRDAGGIVAIKLSNAGGGIEIDHVQFERAVATPGLGAEAGLVAFLLMATLGAAVLRKRSVAA